MQVPTSTMACTPPAVIESTRSSRQSKSQLHSAPPSSLLHVPSSIGQATFAVLGFPVAVLAGAMTVVPAELEAEDPALVVGIVEVETDADEEEVARVITVLLVVDLERGMGEGMLEALS